MKREDIMRAKCLESCIVACERNIEGYEYFRKANEIKIQVNDNTTQPKTMYFTGEVKDKIVDLLVKEESKFLNEKLDELDKL